MRGYAVLVSVFFLVACGDAEDVVMPRTDDMGGAAQIAVHLPFPEGKFLVCTQGAGGTFSHTGRSTAHDLDFDTSNTADEEVFAPVGGRVRVHASRPKVNFGIHVNIELGDGTYLCLGHLKRVFVRDGEYVAAGQLIGYEGCTGTCTGDHVHVGRHLGDAARPAEYGTSIPLRYYVKSTSAGGGTDTFAGDEARCGLENGGTYQSGLKTVLWHPNGSLLKTPDKDTVFLLDRGYARPFQDANAFRSRGYRPEDILTVSRLEPGCYPAGVPVAGSGRVEAGFLNGMGWQFVGEPTGVDRYRVRLPEDAWEPVLESWGMTGVQDVALADLPDNDPRFSSYPIRAGFATFRDGSLVKEEGRSDVYVVADGVALPVWDEDTLRLMGYAPRKSFMVPAGMVRRLFARVGECVTDRGCLLPTTPVRCGGAFVPPADAPSPPQLEEEEREEVPDAGTPPASRTLTIRWDAPSGVSPVRVTLSGEYRLADGSYRVWWRTLVEAHGGSYVQWFLADVHAGETLRFSVEFAEGNGAVSWSCLGPYPDHPTVRGTASASVNGQAVPVLMAADPNSSGCGLLVTVP